MSKLAGSLGLSVSSGKQRRVVRGRRTSKISKQAMLGEVLNFAGGHVPVSNGDKNIRRLKHMSNVKHTIGLHVNGK